MKSTYPTLLSISLTLSVFFIASCSKHFDNSNGAVPPPDSTQHPATPPIAQVDTVKAMFVSGGRSHFLYAVNPGNGSIKWTATLGGNVSFSPAYSKGKIFVGASDQKLYSYDTLGNLIWSVPFANPLSSAPVVSNDIVYVSDTSSVYALDPNTGNVRWQFSQGGTGHLVLAGNTVYFNTRYYYLYAIDAGTGTEKWHYFTRSTYPPVLSDNKVYYMVDDGSLQVLSPATGVLISSLVGPFYFPSPVSYNVNYGNIYVLVDAQTPGLRVTDTASPAHSKFSFNSNISAFPGITPILADSLAILPYAVLNAMTGADLHVNILLDYETTGLSYLNGIAYCLTLQKDDYNLTTGDHIYADIFALNVKTNQVLWRNSVSNADFFSVEPCIVTKSGLAFTGGLTFK